MPYKTIEVRRLNPVIGAEISGVDLSKDLDSQQFKELHEALMENLVIFFRNQNLTVEQHKAFGRRFGKLHVHPNAAQELAGHPEILVIKADEGLGAAYAYRATGWRRRHHVRQHVRGVRGPVAAAAAHARGLDRGS